MWLLFLDPSPLRLAVKPPPLSRIMADKRPSDKIKVCALNFYNEVSSIGFTFFSISIGLFIKKLNFSGPLSNHFKSGKEGIGRLSYLGYAAGWPIGPWVSRFWKNGHRQFCRALIGARNLKVWRVYFCLICFLWVLGFSGYVMLQNWGFHVLCR